ncbi:hypothetical protein Tco_0850691 [Tanacetum coccineum]
MLKTPQPSHSPRTNPTQLLQAHANVVSSNQQVSNSFARPNPNPFAFQKSAYPEPQPQKLEPSLETWMQRYMDAHTERTGKFKETIYKKRDEINERMMKIFSLLKEYTKGKAPKNMLVREESSKPITKFLNAISIVMEEENDKEGDDVVYIGVVEQPKVLCDEEIVGDDKKGKDESDEDDKVFNLGWSDYQGELVAGFMYLIDFVILDIEENDYMHLILGIPFLTTARSEIRCSDGSMTIRSWKFKVRISLANHSYVYLTGVAKDVFVEVAGFMYPIDFVILDIEENDYMHLILEMPFLTTARSEIRYSDGSMMIRPGKFKSYGTIHGEYKRMILDSVRNGPLVWPTIVQEDGTTRKKKYEELSVAEKLQADCDLKATNIIL